MKKKIGVMVLAALLLAVGGVAFAESVNPWKIEFDDGGMSELKIVSAATWSSSSTLEVTYSADKAVGTVEFEFVVYYKSSRFGGYTSNHNISNTEYIITSRKASTFRFKLPSDVIDGFDRIVIKASKK